MFISKRRNNCNNGTLYTLIWKSRIDESSHTETLLSYDINPISEDYIKNILITQAAHDDIHALLDTVSESIPVQEATH